MADDALPALQRAAGVVAELDPATAWDLDAELDGLARVAVTLAEGLDAWGERLGQLGLHESVTGAATTGSEDLAEVARAFTTARRNLRTVYAAQFAAAEADVSAVDRSGFWGTAAAATSTPAPAGAGSRSDSPPAPPAAPNHSGYNPDQPRATDGKWTKVGDVLDVADEDICWGSDQVKGAGPVPTNLALMDYDGHSGEPGWGNGGQYVEVATPPPDKPGDVMANPNLSPEEAEVAAGHLEELARLAESGYRPPKPSKHARAAQRLQHMIDEGNAGVNDPVGVGEDGEFPLTHRELLQLLRDKDPAGVTGTARRKVAARASAAAGGERGVLWMDLEPGPDGTRIAVTAIEGDSDTPDDEFWKPYTAHHTPNSARELAGKLRAFARAARKRPATS